MVGGEDIVMFQQSQQKAAAAEFMRYLDSLDVQLQWATVGQMPVLNAAVTSDTIKNHPFFGVFMDQLKTAKARTPHPNWSKIEEIMTNTGAAILTGKADVQTRPGRRRQADRSAAGARPITPPPTPPHFSPEKWGGEK